MKTISRLLTSGLLFIAASFFFPGDTSAAEAFPWEIRKAGDQEYVPLEQVRKFYAFTRLSREDSDITLENAKVAIHLKIGSTDCTMNGIRFVLGSPVIEIDGAACIQRGDLSGLLDPALRPGDIADATDFKTIVLDPAGEPTQPDHTLAIANLAKTDLEAKGFKIVMTRGADTSPSPKERVELANAVTESALFISISLGTNTEKQTGIETIPLSLSNSPDDAAKSGPASVALSSAIHGTVISKLGKNTTDAGIRQAPVESLSGINHPAVLIRVGSLSQPYESRLIADKSYQKAVASGIASGIKKYQFAVARSNRKPDSGATE